MNWREYDLNLGYSAEEELWCHLLLSLTEGLLQMMPKGERGITYAVSLNGNHSEYSYTFRTSL